jgi:hypothetical protein
MKSTSGFLQDPIDTQCESRRQGFLYYFIAEEFPLMAIRRESVEFGFIPDEYITPNIKLGATRVVIAIELYRNFIEP